MSIAYRFDVQISFPVVIEDDSDFPITMDEARRHVVENLREHVDSADLSDAVVSEGMKL